VPNLQTRPALRDDASVELTVRTEGRGSSPAVLYDPRRDLYYPKPALRGWLHLVAFEVSLVLGTLLIHRAHGVRHVVAAAVFAGSISGLFGASALYHRGNWDRFWTAVLQRLDHTMIFVVIAATATPVFLLAAPGTLGVAGLWVLWTLAAVAVLIHVNWMHAPATLLGVAFVTVALVACSAIPEVWIHAGVVPALLMIVSGLLDGAGAIAFRRRRPDPSPSVFGYHEVFHTYTCVAAILQYIAIAIFII
jgi:hemolysin III